MLIIKLIEHLFSFLFKFIPFFLLLLLMLFKVCFCKFLLFTIVWVAICFTETSISIFISINVIGLTKWMFFIILFVIIIRVPPLFFFCHILPVLKWIMVWSTSLSKSFIEIIDIIEIKSLRSSLLLLSTRLASLSSSKRPLLIVTLSLIII